MMQKELSLLPKIASLWLDKSYPLRQEALSLAAPEYGLSLPSFELALQWIFEQWTEEKISQLAAQNPYAHRRYAAQVLAGTTPAMMAQGFLQGALLQIPQALKIPRQQTQFACLLHQSFAENAPGLAKLFTLYDEKVDLFYQELAKADLVFAYGHDETLRLLKNYLNPNATFVAHGAVDSAALILKEAEPLSALQNLAYDFLSYDQRGCLSPRVTYIEKGGALSPSACAKMFAEEILPKLAHVLPRGALFPGEAEGILHQRNLYGFRGQVYWGEDWTVCYEDNQEWPEQSLPRFMVFKPYESQEVFTLRKESLISLGYAGLEERIEELNKLLKTRTCELGQMQRQLLCL